MALFYCTCHPLAHTSSHVQSQIQNGSVTETQIALQTNRLKLQFSVVQMICSYSAVVCHFKLLKCVLPESILIKELLGTVKALPSTACRDCVHADPEEGWAWVPDTWSDGLLASQVEYEKRAEWYPGSCTFISTTHLSQEVPHCQTLQRLFLIPVGEQGLLGNRLENAWQPVWFYVWRAQMVVGGSIKPKDALQRG